MKNKWILLLTCAIFLASCRKYTVKLPDGTKAQMKEGTFVDALSGTAITSIYDSVTIATKEKGTSVWRNMYYPGHEPAKDRIDSFVFDGIWYYTAYVILQ